LFARFRTSETVAALAWWPALQGKPVEGMDVARLAPPPPPPPAVSRVVGLFHRKGSARRELIEVVDAIHGQAIVNPWTLF
jgi:hypothetical protein